MAWSMSPAEQYPRIIAANVEKSGSNPVLIISRKIALACVISAFLAAALSTARKVAKSTTEPVRCAALIILVLNEGPDGAQATVKVREMLAWPMLVAGACQQALLVSRKADSKSPKPTQTSSAAL
eukprot:CAMPEP_0172814196 /NCGR_PEP_ID=MMETSP1075-20121228/11111_1 /TAXON_ID=2916 /ORGANISM="Ceratium fusus, Strain PA161109" /LENGTH=124 /DNA_ID=CAMNT_0013653983 /DNA_START=464 /DNA_END=838 /DNA_ORIENTATION=+